MVQSVTETGNLRGQMERFSTTRQHRDRPFGSLDADGWLAVGFWFAWELALFLSLGGSFLALVGRSAD